MKKQFYNTDLFVYVNGVVCSSVCVPEDMPTEKIEELTNNQNPSGVTPWKISKDKKFSGGEPMPKKCENYSKEKRLHYLLNC